ncbi:hypothetical protein MPSI1_000645 [Malassezia psittaci]|uniref:Uncharacterized protein n=1 Tax=Malassezia psittaci TaxID=1821823 RepID=A0AAF0FBP0_9BASI|nr:hypothetical protein MPSI1_000645 [Malassezia psittaci]
MATGSTWWIGICITISSNVLISLALNCQKLAHMKIDQAAQRQQSDPEEVPLLVRAVPVNYLRSKLWWSGLALMLIGEAGNFISYGLTPASLVAPLGAVALLSNVIIAPAMLHEHIHMSDIIGIIFAMAGAIGVVSSAEPSGDDQLDPTRLKLALTRPSFLIYTGVMLLLAIVFISICATQPGQKSLLAHVGTCAVFGGFTVLATKGISSFLLLDLGDAHEWILHEPLFYLLFVILVGTAVIQLVYLNRALQLFDSRHVIPTQFVLFTVSTISGSAILYRDFAQMSWLKTSGFLIAVLTTFLAVNILTSSSNTIDAVDEEGLTSYANQTSILTGEIPHDASLQPPNTSPVEVTDTSNDTVSRTYLGSRRRAYTTPNPHDAPGIDRPSQKLANFAAALVEQSQTYLRRGHSNPWRASEQSYSAQYSSESLSGSVDDRLQVRTPQSQAYLCISPGRNLLLVPNQSSPPTPHAVGTVGGRASPSRPSRHIRRGSALASLLYRNND